VEPLKTLFALALASAVTTAYRPEPQVAVFDLEFVDTSIESATNGPRSDKGGRLARLDCEMRQRLTQSGRANVVDVAHVADRSHASDLRTCGGCDAGFANEFGAQVFGYRVGSESFQSHSQHEYRYARRRNRGSHVEQERRYAGPTDESWSRALDWLVDCYLLAPGTGVF
jgi:Protein of unknown function (DUF2380)